MFEVYLKIKKLNEKAIIPTCGSEEAAGYDLYSVVDEYIAPHETKFIGTGIAIEISSNYFGAIYPRSGLSTKQGLRLANCVGVIDSDYRGEVLVALHNDSNVERNITVGDRIAQLIIQPYMKPFIEEVDELSDTDRGTGGFGSTGIK